MNRYWQTPIGIKDGMVVYVSDAALAQNDEREIKEALGMVRRYPVKTDLSGNVVMVEGDSHEDAVRRYLTRTEKPHNVKLTGRRSEAEGTNSSAVGGPC